MKYLKLNILKSKIELLFGSATYTFTMLKSGIDLIKSIIKKFEKAPNIPTDPSPSDNSTNVDLNVNLSWICVDPTLFDKVKFDIYFGMTNPPPLIISSHNTNYYEIGAQSSNPTYYWKIVAIDKHGKTTTSPIWSFKTQ